jgi:hypothetical protein
VDKQGHLSDDSWLLGTAEVLQKITKRVMQRGFLGQFRGVKDVIYGSLSAFSCDSDWFLHHCKVLEKTENPKEELLVGGGSYFSLEGFPHPKHVTSRSAA